MTWELHSPDLPFLSEITVTQVKHGFWENALLYSPLLSAGFALIGTCAAFWIGTQARRISNEQRIIAENKLQLDLFDRRNKIISVFFESIMKISYNSFKKKEEIDCIIDNLYEVQVLAAFLFKEEYLSSLSGARSEITKLASLKIKKINNKEPTPNIDQDIDDLKKSMMTHIDALGEIMKIYTPEFINTKIPTSRASPASPDKPQPAAPAADQSPPTP